MASTVGSVTCPLLIGRDELLDLTDRRLDDVEAGRGQFLLVAGEAGIGKSRFLFAIDQKARERGFVSEWGMVAPQDRDVPAASILDLARSMLRIPVFADLGRDLLALRDATLDAEQVHRRQLVMDIVDRILAGLPDRTLLGFDDLQWADDLSLEIIAELARRSRDRRIMLCGGYRTDEAVPGTTLRDWRSRLLTQRIAEEVRLEPLSPQETALVTTLILDTGLPAPRQVADAVFERTDGIPLHIEELLGALSADARANGYAIREARVPDTIEDAVLARLSHRSPEAQAVARAGAIIGRCFIPEVLAGIMDVPPESIDAPLQELVDAFVLEAPGLRGLMDFRHQLLRDAIYRSVPAPDRRRFHARAGEFGTQLEGQSEIHSSLHYERAGMRRQAFETALAGARDSARLSAHREAFELYRRAVDNMPADLGPGDRAAILEAYATEASNIEENETAEEIGRKAAAAYREAGDVPRALISLAGIVNSETRQGRPVSERLAHLAELRAELDTCADGPETREAAAQIAAMAAITHTDARSYEAARDELAIVRENAERLGDDEWVTFVDWKANAVDSAEGVIGDAVAKMGAVALEAERRGWESTGVSAFRDAAKWAANAMDYAEASRWLDAGLRYADSIEQSFCAHIMTATSAVVEWAGADWVAAETAARQALADRGCRRGAEMARVALGYIDIGRGEYAKAAAELGASLRFGEQSESIELVLPPLWGLAELALHAGEPDRAVAMCDDALARSKAVGERVMLIPFVVTGVRAAIAAGRPADATTLLGSFREYLGDTIGVTQVALEHARGLVALTDGATGVARTALEAAIAGWDATGRTWEASWARLDLAHCLVRSNRYADALSLAVDVRTLASRLDSRPLADRADAIQRMARGRVAVDEPWRPLTAREFEVARLISEGHTNAEIAEQLGIAPKTASAHVEHILAKLGASRRAEIAAWTSAVGQGIRPV